MPANKIEFNNEVLIDLTQDTATEEDVAVGKTFHKADGSVATGVARVGTVVEKDVNFYDYDGTLLYSYTVDEARNMEELPPLPKQPGLICQEWNHTLEEVKDVDVAIDIGATYITDDGKTRFYIEPFTDSFKVGLYLCKNVANGARIDWGDGTPIENALYASTAMYDHTYAVKGEYVITVDVDDGVFVYLGGNSTGLQVFQNYNHSTNTTNVFLKKVELGNRVAMFDRAFENCVMLETITIPSLSLEYNNTILPTYSLWGTHSLKCIVLPRSITRYNSNCMTYTGAKKIIFTKTATASGYYIA